MSEFLRDDGTFATVTSADVSGVRTVLSSSRDYFVRTNGSDSNAGTANTTAGAFLTIQKAVDTIAALDLNNKSVSISVSSGTYTGAVSVSAPWVGGGSVTLIGNSTAPDLHFINTAASCITLTGYALMSISGFKLAASAGSALNIVRYSLLAVTGGMEYGACSGNHFAIQSCARVTVGANYAISGGAATHIAAQENAVFLGNGLTVTITTTPAFSTGYALCEGGSLIRQRTATFTGNATGPRYVLQTNGTIDTASGASTYFPGDSTGTGDGQAGGLYT